MGSPVSLDDSPDAAPSALDLVGIGFGPSNLALAIALREHQPRTDTGQAGVDALRALFLERQPQFGWHRGMLLEDTTMQVSFLKDLVSLRSPTSDFSFLAYLQAKGRLIDFINHKTLFPLRAEFHDYLEWAAARVSDAVRYARTVTELRPVLGDGVVETIEVQTRDASGSAEVLLTRNVVLGVGLSPRLPPGVSATARIWHNHDLLTRIEDLGAAPSRVVVVGAGQSAAEVTAFLHARYPATEVCAVFRRYGYSPSDDSPFANQIFDPDAVGEFFAAPPDVKSMLNGYHANTNYSVVDLELIERLYAIAYREQVSGRRRLRMMRASEVIDTVEHADRVQVTVNELTTGERMNLDADVLIYCTGYAPANPWPLLGELGGYCHRDEAGRPRIDRDFRVLTSTALRAGIYVQGATEHTHGLSSTLLSNSAVRAGDILDSVLLSRATGREHREQQPV
ncbi:MAG: lysine N(6)-hydroxylase/L-ornithine N(5)-oxygenase family protein [Sporichthyaceae bacterium]